MYPITSQESNKLQKLYGRFYGERPYLFSTFLLTDTLRDFTTYFYVPFTSFRDTSLSTSEISFGYTNISASVTGKTTRSWIKDGNVDGF